MDEMIKLKKKIDFLANFGEMAAANEQVELAIAIAKRLTPLLHQMAVFTGDDSWIDYAEQGQRLVDKYTQEGP